MATYLIGDVQGCDEALGRLLDTLDFSPSRDTAYLLGDLVNRGPQSLAVLRRLMAMDGAARCVLGNHDLHLLAVAQGVRKPHRKDTLQEVLASPRWPQIETWLRTRPLAIEAHGWQFGEIPALPQWTAQDTLALAGEVQQVLSGPDWRTFLHQMYGNHPDRWAPRLQGPERWRVVVNALTRLRFCSVDGQMEFDSKDGAHTAPAGFMPWFDVPGRRTAGVPIAFGHWSTLGLVERPDLLALDTGCVWGGCLSAARLPEQSSAPASLAFIQVECPQAQKPGT